MGPHYMLYYIFVCNFLTYTGQVHTQEGYVTQALATTTSMYCKVENWLKLIAATGSICHDHAMFHHWKAKIDKG